MRILPIQTQECEELSDAHHGDEAAIKTELDQQFQTLHGRAQLLLGICGVLLTASVLITTGRIIGRGGYALARLAGWFLALAGLCDITATAIIVVGVLHIRWLTQVPGQDRSAWLLRAVAHRDRKTTAYHVALAVIVLSMVFYQGAVLIVMMQL